MKTSLGDDRYLRITIWSLVAETSRTIGLFLFFYSPEKEGITDEYRSTVIIFFVIKVWDKRLYDVLRSRYLPIKQGNLGTVWFVFHLVFCI